MHPQGQLQGGLNEIAGRRDPQRQPEDVGHQFAGFVLIAVLAYSAGSSSMAPMKASVPFQGRDAEIGLVVLASREPGPRTLHYSGVPTRGVEMTTGSESR